MTSLRFLPLILLGALLIGPLNTVKNAQAKGTVLCTVHEEPCMANNRPGELHATLTAGTEWLLTNKEPEINILCLKALLGGIVGALAEAREPLYINALTFSGCGTEGTGGSHSNCMVTSNAEVGNPFMMWAEKTALNLATIEPEGGLLIEKCTLVGFVTIECEEELGTVLHLKGAGNGNHGMIEVTSARFSGGNGTLCPEEGEITSSLFEPLENVYVVE